jgi:hypothetical protein
MWFAVPAHFAPSPCGMDTLVHTLLFRTLGLTLRNAGWSFCVLGTLGRIEWIAGDADFVQKT